MTMFTPRMRHVCARLEFADLPHGGPGNLAIIAQMVYNFGCLPGQKVARLFHCRIYSTLLILRTARLRQTCFCPGRLSIMKQAGFRF